MPHRLPASSRRAILSATIASLLLTACGGGSPGAGPSPAPTPTPTPTPTSSQCTLRDRQLWAEAQIREWYLFPETLPASINPAQYATLDDFIDALTATARAQNKDRFFTFATSIAEEDAFITQGETAAFGVQLRYDSANRELTVLDAYEFAPALTAGIDRGARITAIGPSEQQLTPVADLFASGGSLAVADAFGPSAAGVTRAIRFAPVGQSERTVTITKAVFNIPPVSPRFGVSFRADTSGTVGYVNLRTFISSARAPLREAFDRFRSAAVDRVIIDFRYNGGGLVTVAEEMGDLMGRNRLPSDVFSFTRFRASKSAENETRLFRPLSQSIAPTGLAFITTEDSASASELVINSMLPYTQGNIHLVGSNTSGKPVGQIAIDRPACDDRLRIVAFATDNANRQGDYFNGLAPDFAARGGRTCAAQDIPSLQMGEPGESMTMRAMDALRPGGSCQSFVAAADQRIQSTTVVERTRPALLRARRPSAAQHEIPGLF
ncbi:S41 family peptidase [Sandarakinorhabdus rubra]|uniref:S41 family peptidase n=1 Tax=Sandarakinorhabdus rubra TaxID=2672568 RepID=UPI0013D9ADB6|nr:S41 family peptidase [Sandarakinorhabdus rubra]